MSAAKAGPLKASTAAIAPLASIFFTAKPPAPVVSPLGVTWNHRKACRFSATLETNRTVVRPRRGLRRRYPVDPGKTEIKYSYCFGFFTLPPKQQPGPP